MKTVCILDSVSRANGGIFEAERRLQQHLQAKAGLQVNVIGLRDVHSEADLAAWAPLMPRTLPVKGPRAFGFAAELENALNEIDADIGYQAGLWKFPSVATRRWSRRKGKPVVIAPHGMLEPWALRNSATKKKIAGWLFQNEQLRQAACLRALCAAEAVAIRAYGLNNPICVIPNGIDLPSLANKSGRGESPSSSHRKTLLYLGRLHPKKGLTTLVEAWSQVQARAGEWVLAIAGWDQGGHEEELKRQATNLGVPWKDDGFANSQESSIHFLGPQFNEAKEDCYRSCDAFILPSLSEGLPMVVLEAWAFGKPVLMTEACNLPEGVRSNAALSIESSVDGICSGLLRLFSFSADERGVMGRNGRGLVEQKFDWQKSAMQMASVYEWILGGGARPSCVEVR